MSRLAKKPLKEAEQEIMDKYGITRKEIYTILKADMAFKGCLAEHLDIDSFDLYRDNKYFIRLFHGLARLAIKPITVWENLYKNNHITKETYEEGLEYSKKNYTTFSEHYIKGNPMCTTTEKKGIKLKPYFRKDSHMYNKSYKHSKSEMHKIIYKLKHKEK